MSPGETASGGGAPEEPGAAELFTRSEGEEFEGSRLGEVPEAEEQEEGWPRSGEEVGEEGGAGVPGEEEAQGNQELLQQLNSSTKRWMPIRRSDRFNIVKRKTFKTKKSYC